MGLVFYLFLLFLHYSSFSSADPLSQNCGGSKYTINSTYNSNLNSLLNLFSSLNSTSFANRTEGLAPDSVYGLVLCRGDVSSSDCTSCIQNAAQDVLSLCPGSKQATVWYDNCELRYSDLRFFSTFGNANPLILYNTKKATGDVENFIRVQRKLLDNVTHQAAYNSSLMFATGTATNGSDVTVNGLAQCTRDLSKDGCSQCLKQIRDIYTSYGYLEASQGGRVLVGSCNFRYEVYSFFQGKPTVLLNLTASLPPSPPPPPPSTPTSAGGEGIYSMSMKGSKSNTGKVLAIVIPLVAVIVMLAIGICIFFWKKRPVKKSISGTGRTANLEGISNVDPISFDLSTLEIATDNFSEVNKIGEGGFGSVYKGKLEHGQEIAVKRLSTTSTQGLEELKNELFLVAKLQHRNLVKLFGVCLEEEEKLLVYEYVPNRSLDKFLFDPVKCKQLNWERRFNIIGGIARGLFYLHEESHHNVIHRDLKASNILLDSDMSPKISDFGLARLFGGDETQGTTSRVVGTFGYMAPEYALRGHFSTKVDVFSYGVLALEVVTGRSSSSFLDSQHAEDLLTYIWRHWSNGTISEVIDPSMENCSTNEVLRCVHIALLCVQEVPTERPPMSTVVLMLHSPSVPLNPPSQPILFHGMVDANLNPPKPTDMDSGDQFTSRSIQFSVNDVSITELQPR